MIATSQSIRVVCGVHNYTFPFEGQMVVEMKSALAEVFSISHFAEALVNGEHATMDRLLQPGDLLSFRRRFGFKRGEDRPRNEVEAEGLLRTYPGLSKIGREVRAMGLDGPDSIEILLRMVAKWCHAEFGPVVEPMKATIECLAKKIQMSEATMDGPTEFGEVRMDENNYDLRLTPPEIRLVRVLWNREPLNTESVCEAVYGEDDQCYTGIKDIKKRASKKLKKCKLKIISRNEQYRLIDIGSDSDKATICAST